MSEKLKPCPDCKSKRLIFTTRLKQMAVECIECGYRHTFKNNQEEATKAWNTRARKGEKLKPFPLSLPLVLKEIDGAYWVEDSKGRVAIHSTRLSEKKHHDFLRWVVDTANTRADGKGEK